jgi:hypothetical protein
VLHDERTGQVIVDAGYWSEAYADFGDVEGELFTANN